MATEVVKIVDPDNGSGTHYTSLSAWEAGEERDLVSADEIAVAKCRCTGGTPDTAQANIAGWTTSSSCYIKIWTDPAEGYRHNGTRSTGNKYRLVHSGEWTYAFRTDGTEDQYIYAEGIEFGTTSTCKSGPVYLRNSGSNSSIHLDRCIAWRDNTTSSASCFSFPSGKYAYFTNCAVLGNKNGSGYHIGTISSVIGYYYNCTAMNCSGYGFYVSDYRTMYAKNCYAGGSGTADYGKGANGDLYLTTCYSSDGSQSTSTAAFATSTGAKFVNITSGSEDPHIQAGSSLIGVGTNLHNDPVKPFQNDIDGQDRGGSGASWDIGADEYVTAGVQVSIPDTGTGEDALAQLAVGLGLADSAAGADGFTGQAQLPAIPDAAAGADAVVDLTVGLQLADAAAAADLVSFVQRLSQLADSGSGADVLAGLNVVLSVADAGVGIDASATHVLIGISDGGAGADALAQILAALAAADGGSGGDAIAQLAAVLSELADSGAGVDAVSVAPAGDLKSVLDAGSGSDALGVTIALQVADSAAGADLIAQILSMAALADSGSGSDQLQGLAALLSAIADSGSGTDTAAVGQTGQWLSIADAGAGSDALSAFSVMLTVGDAAAAADLVSQVLATVAAISDAAAAADLVTVLTFLPKGRVRIAFTCKRPGMACSGKRPGMAYSARKPGIHIH